MWLMPFLIARAAEKGDWTRVEKMGARVCMECGNCSYICPGGVDVSAKMISAKKQLDTIPPAAEEDTVIPESEGKEDVTREEE